MTQVKKYLHHNGIISAMRTPVNKWPQKFKKILLHTDKKKGLEKGVSDIFYKKILTVKIFLFIIKVNKIFFTIGSMQLAE
ncbi:hypothetical protein I4200191B4_28440 [Pseudoflavonifractor gallinarum]